jgi:acetyl-CoA carboxylase biotin carboxyl carrier protein
MPKKEENSKAPDLPENEEASEESKKPSDLPKIPESEEPASSNDNSEEETLDTTEEETVVKETIKEPEDSPVNLQLVKYLMQVFEESSVTEFEVSQGDFQLMLSKNSSAPAAFATAPAVSPPIPPTPDGGSASKAADESNHIIIKSPMVGTFYRAASPDADPFVDIGEKVHESTLVCIIEAMKVMNEIPAECNGTIVDILVENGHGVEYGQPLFKVAKK